MKWSKQHKWSGIICCFFMLMFCLSGIILNHRGLFAGVEISRRLLPSSYAHENWNGGLLRGTLPWQGGTFIYGSGGVWKTDSTLSQVADFNRGIGSGDHRQIRAMAATSDGRLYSASTHDLYLYDPSLEEWLREFIELAPDDRISDLTVRGDSVVVVGRSFVYLSPAVDKPFETIQLQTVPGETRKITLFRTIWLLHSGELFGLAGKLIVDGIAIVLLILCVTGVTLFIVKPLNRRRAGKGKDISSGVKCLKTNHKWHVKIGAATIVLTLLVAITGWFLRPPGMIPLAMTKTSPLPGSSIDSDNRWHDLLRMARYDAQAGEWLVSTSEGFIAMADFEAVPRRLSAVPPVSVMGLNAWEKDADGIWLCGSFSGMYRWDRESGIITDFFTGEAPAGGRRAMMGAKAVSGLAWNSDGTPAPVDYYAGTDALEQPRELRFLPMPLFNVALEIHTGRMFIGSLATMWFVFLMGGCVIWCLWSGWEMHHGPRKNKARRGPDKNGGRKVRGFTRKLVITRKNPRKVSEPVELP